MAATEGIDADVRGRYGRPRRTAEWTARGHACSENTVAKRMREYGIRAKCPRRFVRTTDSRHARPVADTVLDRAFDPPAPNAVWAAALTDIPTADGWSSLAVVEDRFSRRIVGWAMAATMESRPGVEALDMAIRRRRPGEGRVAHSDRGSQSASDHSQRALERSGIRCRMSRVAQCGDNAPVESVFASLKRERIPDDRYTTREQARASIFEYVEVFDHRVRRHSSLGFVSPAEFERTHNPKRP